MAKHQIIYTSCMRGIDGVNDGQQIFSYDEAFKDSKTDDVKRLFTYQIPSLPSGVIMTEEIAKTMPVAFMYRALKNGNAAITLNTYLGRDYMGSAGRFGNHLSHSIVCDYDDFDVYPCEMYKSQDLRSSMEYEEVNNPDIPDYLPVPLLTKGDMISQDSIQDFLGEDENLEFYKQMVMAMLSYDKERKRIIICDTTDNIVRWIAALHYTMPLDIAKKVNFTTYEFDPELSSSQICGVITEGSKYNSTNYVMSKKHYVFDFLDNEFNKKDYQNKFIDFLDVAFNYSYESLLEFHQFVISKTTYRSCDDKYCAAYYLYYLLTHGIKDVSKKEFDEIEQFAVEYLPQEVRKSLYVKLLEDSEHIKYFDNDYAINVLLFLLKAQNELDTFQQRIVKQMIMDRLISTFSIEGISESDFMPLYDKVVSMAEIVGLSLPVELMQENNRESLLGVLSQNTDMWKIDLVIQILGNYVMDMKVSTDDLHPNSSIGAIYYGIIKAVYSADIDKGRNLSRNILTEFSSHSDYLVNMVLNLEGYMKDMELPETETDNIWNHFTKIVMSMTDRDIVYINKYLEEYKRYGEMYMLYCESMDMISDFEDVRVYFEDYWNKWIKRHEYGQEYAVDILKKYEETYEKKLESIIEKNQFKYACEILELAIKMEIKDEFVTSLCDAVCEFIPFFKVSSENKKLIYDIYHYQRDVLQIKIKGRLLLFIIAFKCNKITKKSDIRKAVTEIMDASVETGAKLSEVPDDKIEDYFEWAFGVILNFTLDLNDFADIYGMFQFSKHTQTVFMVYWCKTLYKSCKADKDYADFAEFLLFMFEFGNEEDQKETAKYLCKLNKHKLEDLDEEMRTYFKRDHKAMQKWNGIMDVATSTNSILNNISNLFKRK